MPKTKSTSTEPSAPAIDPLATNLFTNFMSSSNSETGEGGGAAAATLKLSDEDRSKALSVFD